MSDCVWWVRTDPLAQDRWAFSVTKPEVSLRERVHGWQRVQEAGGRFPDDCKPLEMQCVHNLNGDGTIGSKKKPATDEKGRRLPNMFYQTYFCIAHEAIEVFQKFDLGEAQFYEVGFLEADGTTKIDEPVYILIPANPKNAFRFSNPDNAAAALENPQDISSRRAKSGIPDDAVGVTSDALGGAHVWIEPNFNGTFFVSDSLAQALRVAGVGADFRLARAQIV